MRNETPFDLNDETGTYTTRRPVSAKEILFQAELILEDKFRPGVKLESPESSEALLRGKLAHREREVFCVLFLTTRHTLIKYEELFQGSIDGATVYPREIVKRALQLNAAAVILAHNHPSGVGEPSTADQAITRRIKSALELVDIRMLDHLIVGGTEVVSMAKRGML